MASSVSDFEEPWGCCCRLRVLFEPTNMPSSMSPSSSSPMELNLAVLVRLAALEGGVASPPTWVCCCCSSALRLTSVVIPAGRRRSSPNESPGDAIARVR